VTDTGAQAGWYPDPERAGWQRYFDGAAWTEHRAPSPGFAPSGYGQPWPPSPPWKGAQFGRPRYGPGALATPGRRLGARALDALVLLPVLALFVVIAVILVAPHAGPLFPRNDTDQYGPSPTPGIVWIYLAVIACVVATGVVMVIYEGVATARYGRTLGKAWLRIRPVRIDGSPLGWGRSFGRISIYWISGFLSWVGLLDPLWCLWDANQQCLHDKVVGSLVINDGSAEESTGESVSSSGVSDVMPMAPGGWQTPGGNWPPTPQHLPVVVYGPVYGQRVMWPVFPRNDGLAVASLVCSIAGILFVGVPAIPGVIFGFVARSRISGSNGMLTGDGLALAGIITGFVVIGGWALLLVLPHVL